MKMEHKQEIIQTRSHGLGSSDAKMVVSVARNNKITMTAEKRIDEMLGRRERKQFGTKSMDHGNYIEDEIYKVLKQLKPTMVSNPFFENTLFAKKMGFSVFNHIDFEVVENGTLKWFECKAVNDDIVSTIKHYNEQLAWHYLLGELKANLQGLKFELYVVHYRTKDKTSVFDAKNIKTKKIQKDDDVILMIAKGLGIIKKYLEEIK